MAQGWNLKITLGPSPLNQPTAFLGGKEPSKEILQIFQELRENQSQIKRESCVHEDRAACLEIRKREAGRERGREREHISSMVRKPEQVAMAGKVQCDFAGDVNKEQQGLKPEKMETMYLECWEGIYEVGVFKILLWMQRNRTACITLALHTVNLSFFPGIKYGPLSTETGMSPYHQVWLRIWEKLPLSSFCF